jgi:hypothetical protein
MSDDEQLLARILTQSFVEPERKTLLRDLGVSPDQVAIRPATGAEHAWAIVEYFARRGRLHDLRQAVQRLRPPTGLTVVQLQRDGQGARVVRKYEGAFVDPKRPDWAR